MYSHPSPSFSLLSIHLSVYLLICVHLLPLLLHPFLWLFLVFDIFLQDFAREGIGLAERHQLTQVLYDELMTAILRVIGKLDFSAISKEGEVWFFCYPCIISFLFPPYCFVACICFSLSVCFLFLLWIIPLEHGCLQAWDSQTIWRVKIVKPLRDFC